MKYTIKSPRLFMLLGIRIIITHIIKLNILFLYIFNNFIRWWWLLPLFPLLFSNKSMQCHNFSLKVPKQIILLLQLDFFFRLLFFPMLHSFLGNLYFFEYISILFFLVGYFGFHLLELGFRNLSIRFLEFFYIICVAFLFLILFIENPNFFLQSN